MFAFKYEWEESANSLELEFRMALSAEWEPESP